MPKRSSHPHPPIESAAPPASRWTWIPTLVLAVGLFATGLSAAYVSLSARTKERIRLDNATARTHDDIQNRLDTYIALLRGTQGLFAASDEVTRQDFRAYVEHLQLDTRFPGIQGIGFSRRIPPEDLEQVTRHLRKEGVEGFQVWPDHPRPEYHSIIYLEPLDWRNRRAIGYDMFSEPVRREAMERARDTGKPVATGKVTLVQETEERPQAGFLIYLPVYRGGVVPEAPEARRADLLGFVYSPFRADDLLSRVAEPEPVVSFQVYDEQPLQDRLLHDSAAMRAGAGPREVVPPHATVPLNVAEREWVLTVTPNLDAVRGASRSQLGITIATGTALSLLLYGATSWLARTRAAAELVAAELRQIEQMRARRTSHLALHADISMALTPGSASVAEIARQCVAAAVRHLHLPLVQIWMLDASGEVLELTASGGLDPPPDGNSGRILPHTNLGRAASQQDMIVREPLPDDPAVIDGQWAHARGITCFTGCPMTAADRRVGLLAAFSRTPLAEDMLDALQTAARLLAQGLERQRTGEALKESEERFRATFSQAAVGITLIDLQHRFMQVNQRFCDIVHYSSEELAGLTWKQITHPDDLEYNAALHDRVLSGELPNMSLEKRYIRKDGRTAWVTVSTSLVRDGRGSPRHTVSVIRDITARKKAEQTVLEQKQELENFVSIAAHDLKHPVVSVQGLLGVLRRTAAGRLDEDARDNLELALTECTRMRDIISQLAQIARIGSEELRTESVNLRRLLKQVAQRFSHVIARKNVTFSLECPEVTATFPRRQVEEALDNLMENALQHGTAVEHPQINLFCSVEASMISIVVQDNGPGIDPRFHARVFEIFRRLDPDGPVQGTGVGLTAVQRLIRRIGGTVSLDSQIHQGARFTLRFPAQITRTS